VLVIVAVSIPFKFCLHSEIFNVKEWRDLETGDRGLSRSLKLAKFNKPYTTSYWSAIANIGLSCTVFELRHVE